jgi:hypothetical protein
MRLGAVGARAVGLIERVGLFVELGSSLRERMWLFVVGFFGFGRIDFCRAVEVVAMRIPAWGLGGVTLKCHR